MMALNILNYSKLRKSNLEKKRNIREKKITKIQNNAIVNLTMFLSRVYRVQEQILLYCILLLSNYYEMYLTAH
jgi:hypothetical protein